MLLTATATHQSISYYFTYYFRILFKGSASAHTYVCFALYKDIRRLDSSLDLDCPFLFGVFMVLLLLCGDRPPAAPNNNDPACMLLDGDLDGDTNNCLFAKAF